MCIEKIIREANLTDHKDIAEVGRKSFKWAFEELFPSDVLVRYLDNTYTEDKITKSLLNKENSYFVAESNRSLVGFLKLKYSCSHNLSSFENQLQLQKIYILPDQANSGLGSKLMKFSEKKIAKISPVLVWLQVYEGNDRAKSFYRRFGYTPIGKDEHLFEEIRIKYTVMSKLFDENC